MLHNSRALIDTRPTERLVNNIDTRISVYRLESDLQLR